VTNNVHIAALMREVWNSVLFVRPQNVAVKVRFLNANFMEVLKLIFSLNFERFSDLPGLLEPSSLFFGETQSSQNTQWETKRACYGGESCTKGVLWSFKFSTGVQLGGEFPVKVSYCPYHILLYLIWELSKHDVDGAIQTLVRFFAVLCKTTTWNDQIQGFM